MICCEELNQAVLEGMVKYTNIIDGAPGFNTYYIESVKTKTVKDLIIAKTTEVITEDIILKHCCFCGSEL